MKEKLKDGRLVALGLIVDADTSLKNRWDSVKDLLSAVGGAPPRHLPRDGLIINVKGKRVGAWIMPDNNTEGMVETFCHALIPDEAKPLWEYAQECTTEAKKRGATYHDNHFDKAHMATWLAWNDPPGLRMGTALTRKVLHHGTDEARTFVGWFRALFDVQEL